MTIHDHQEQPLPPAADRMIRFAGVHAILQPQHNFVFIEAIYALTEIRRIHRIDRFVPHPHYLVDNDDLRA